MYARLSERVTGVIVMVEIVCLLHLWSLLMMIRNYGVAMVVSAEHKLIEASQRRLKHCVHSLICLLDSTKATERDIASCVCLL